MNLSQLQTAVKARMDKIENDTAPRLRSAIKRDTGAHF